MALIQESTVDPTIKALRNALDKRFTEIGEALIEQVAADFKRKCRDACAEVAVSLAMQSNIERMRDELVIRVRFEEKK